MREKIFIIAEAGVNHNGSLERALALVDAAAAAGADAVKFQTFKADRLVTKSAEKARYQKQTTEAAESQHEMIRKLELRDEDHFALQSRCAERGVEFMSSPFDVESLRFLTNELRVKHLKLGSGEMTNAPILRVAAESGIPLILSTGMSVLEEVDESVGVLAYFYLNPRTVVRPSRADFSEARASEAGKKILREKLTLLHCTTEYPTPFASVNLRAMQTLRERYSLSVGFSDHTPGISAPTAAAALGASVIEKHFTLDRGLPGPDHKASLEPAELAAMVKAIREVEASLGQADKVAQACEIGNRDVARKSLTVSQPLKRGEEFTEANLTTKRPGHGASPFEYWDWLGRRASRDLDVDHTLTSGDRE